MNKLLDYKDITLIPTQLSTIASRDDIDTSVEFCGRILTVPIIASPMKDVCNGNVAKVMRENGAFGIIHRFQSVDKQVLDFIEAGDAGCAIGIQTAEEERLDALYRVGCKVFCVDVANSFNIRVQQFVEYIQNKYKNLYVIVGNIASCEGYHHAVSMKASACRTGVAGGEACSTRYTTGVYSPPVSLIEDCFNVVRYSIYNHKCSIIADGGIKGPDDFVKSIICGADVAMLGSKLANTQESPADVISRDGRQYTVFSGSASFVNQAIYKDKPKYIEGRTKELEYTGQTIKDVIENFMEGLRSSMSYFNARNLDEFRKNKNYGILK